MLETIILIPILWIVMSVLYQMLVKKSEGSKGITPEYVSKDGIKRTAKKEREDFIV